MQQNQPPPPNPDNPRQPVPMPIVHYIIRPSGVPGRLQFNPGQQIRLSHPAILGQQIIRQPTILHQPNSMPTQYFIRQPTASVPSQMNPDEILNKGINLLNSMISRCSGQARITTQNLIKELIEERLTPDEFAIALHEDMNDPSKRNSLVDFLNRFLPHLRLAVRTGKTSIPGTEVIHPPTVYATPAQPSSSFEPPPAKKKKVPPPPGQKTAYAIKKEAALAKKKAKEEKPKLEKQPKPKVEKPKIEKPKRQEKLKKQECDDDDVNDVAAMGGVNLAEESQRIMAAGSETIGTHIRSCKEDLFLDAKSLTARISRIAAKLDLQVPSQQVVVMISHATQERLKNIVERLGILAQQRCENLKMNSSKYEISQDVKGQMKFLAELDRIEKKRSEELEREYLLKAAKSRSKTEDPEQLKIRQRAKELQKAEQELERQKEANETALLAIGPRKKLLTSEPTFTSMNQSDNISRKKRVNMKDVLALFEIDRSNTQQLIKIISRSK